MKMTISVIIPVFNSESRIETCIKNVNRQTAIIDEIIVVVDSRSTDNSIE